MAEDDAPERSWPADVIARMRRIAHAPKSLTDEAWARRAGSTEAETEGRQVNRKRWEQLALGAGMAVLSVSSIFPSVFEWALTAVAGTLAILLFLDFARWFQRQH